MKVAEENPLKVSPAAIVLSNPIQSRWPEVALLPNRAATVVGIPKISRYTDFFQNSVFLEAKGGALLYVQKSVKLGKTWQNLVKLGKTWQKRGKSKFSGGSPARFS